jgi:hypothetical protein
MTYVATASASAREAQSSIAPGAARLASERCPSEVCARDPVRSRQVTPLALTPWPRVHRRGSAPADRSVRRTRRIRRCASPERGGRGTRAGQSSHVRKKSAAPSCLTVRSTAPLRGHCTRTTLGPAPIAALSGVCDA